MLRVTPGGDAHHYNKGYESLLFIKRRFKMIC